MSSSERYERRLTTLLEEISEPRTPDYFDDILGRVGHTRQRPGWTFPERWLPMYAVSGRLVTTPRVPLRVFVAAALLLVALAVAFMAAGSQRLRVPGPFGPAGNGQVMFIDDGGAIRAGDPLNGSSSVIVPSGPNRLPAVSPDGTHVAFLRENRAHDPELVVVDAKGGDPVVLSTAGPLLTTTHVGWMPDSRRVVVDSGEGGALSAYEVVAGATPTTVVDAISRNGLQNELTNLFRPPTAEEILVLGTGSQGFGLYRRPLSGGALVPILTRETSSVLFSNIAGPQWSHDGGRIAFTLHPALNTDLGRVYIVNADGTGLRQVSSFDKPGKMVDEEDVTWSPDGARVAFTRWTVDPVSGEATTYPVTVVDVATGEEHDVGIVNHDGYRGWGWSPDGTSILEVPGTRSPDSGTVVIVDATSGTVTHPGWPASEAATWQRRLP